MAATGDNSIFKTSLRRNVVGSFLGSFDYQSTDKYFLSVGGISGWTGGQTFGSINDTRAADIEFWRNIVGIKQIDFNSVYHMAKKYVWTSGTIYTEYDHTIDMADTDYYVMNSEYNVYKCISNNENTTSAVEPTGIKTQGTMYTSDGYIWKYMFTIPEPHRYYIDDEYIPVAKLTARGTSPQSQNQWSAQKNAVNGSIDYIKLNTVNGNYLSAVVLPHNPSVNIVRNSSAAGATAIDLSAKHVQTTGDYTGLVINITSGDGAGQRRLIAGYTGDTNNVNFATPLTKAVPKNSTYEIAPAVTIYGDGVSAEAFVDLYDYSDGDASRKQVKNIIITNSGKDYSTATLEFSPIAITTNTTGSVYADATPRISPEGGHGFDAVRELNATALLVVVNIDQDEDNNFFLANEVRQYGIIKNPILNDADSQYLNADGKPYRIAGAETTLSTILEITTATTGAFLPETMYTVGKYIIGKKSKATGKIEEWSPSLNGNHGQLIISNLQGNFEPPVDAGGTGEGVLEFSQEANVWEFSLGAGKAAVAGFDKVYKNTPPSYNCTWSLGVSAGSGLDSSTFPVDVGVTGGSAASLVGCTACTTGLCLDWVVNDAGTGGTLVVTDAIGTFNTGDSIGSFSTASPNSYINTVTPPEIYSQSGEILYAQNMKPVLKDDEQREQYQVILKF